MNEHQQQSFNIRDALIILFRHKLKILISFLLIIAVTGAIVLFTPHQFVARAVVMVKLGREFVPVSEVGDVKPQLNQDAIIRTEMEILTSRDLIVRVVKSVGPEELYPELGGKTDPGDSRLEAAVLNFRQNIFVNPVKGSNLLEVYFRHDNPQVASRTVNALLESLKERHLQVFSDPKSSFLEGQLKDYENKLNKTESDMDSFKQRNQVFALDEQRSVLIKERAESESTLKTEQIRARELQQKIAFLKDRKDVFTDATVGELKSKLNSLEQKEQELTEKYNEESQVMINHRKETRVVKEQLQKYEEQVRNAEIVKIQAELEPLQVKITGLQKRYDEVDKELRKLDARTKEFDDLKRQAGANEANYQTYLKKTEEARISDDLDRRKMTNVSVIEEASVTPAKSNQQKVLGLGIFLSIALSFGLAYAAEYIPRRLTTPHNAEKKLGLRVLIAIPKKANLSC
ncbi:MAG: Wzz/FepE/Etk N-terminal domain-containing protein [Syntrophorhabdales bacterium]|jgi:uncharacterized protein involved in exopolysaccharide biosynthesis